MSREAIPFHLVDWSKMDPTEQSGSTGTARTKTLQFSGLRVRMVTYSAGYLANHWCRKGHIVHCLEGELMTEHEDGTQYHLKRGMTYIVSDEQSSHRSRVEREVQLLIIDGDFLSPS